MGVYFDILLNMSITGSVVILVVIIMRFLLARAPKKYSYLLWSIVGFRLLCPFSFNSIISIFNINPFQKPSDIVTKSGRMNYLDAPIYFNNANTGTATIGGADAPENITVAPTLAKGFTLDDFLICTWLVGMCVLLAFGIAGYIKTRNQVRFATKLQDNIFQSENISTPFILGIIKPKIYIPYNTDEDYLEYVIVHEKHHLKRGDNFVKLVAYLLLCVYWFNPLCWVAFYLMNKDMEMSCDEYVLVHYENIKKKYSTALLSFSTDKKITSPSMLCFGEGSIKGRIKNVLKFKKPTVAVSVVVIVLCLSIAAVCVANPKDNEDELLQENENIGITINNEQINNKEIYSVGEPMYLDLKLSINPSAVESLEISDNNVNVLSNNNPTFYGVITHTEAMTGEEFFKHWNDYDLVDVNPFDTSRYSNVEIKYVCEDTNSFDAKYTLYYFDDELMLLGFVYQDENNNDIVNCISEIKNGGNKQKIISNSQAIKIAYEKQVSLYPDMNISFNGAELKNESKQYFAFNTVYNPNESGHSYYGVSYFDNDTICDFYYYCIDAVTGELIYNSMMGD